MSNSAPRHWCLRAMLTRRSPGPCHIFLLGLRCYYQNSDSESTWTKASDRLQNIVSLLIQMVCFSHISKSYFTIVQMEIFLRRKKTSWKTSIREQQFKKGLKLTNVVIHHLHRQGSRRICLAGFWSRYMPGVYKPNSATTTLFFSLFPKFTRIRISRHP